LGESQNHLLDACKQSYISEEEFTDLSRLARRAIGAASKWHRYLMSCPAGDPTAWLDGSSKRKNP
jgi:hypothetical protein